ncbi:MAG: Adenosine kinase, partial [Candidatus Gottesmanbacteria bacterium GW2011_GWA2_44_17]
AGYVRGCDLKTCGQMGSVAAVYTVEKYGTVTHTYTKKQFIERYQKNYGTKISLK